MENIPARELLRKNGIEIALDDFRPPVEIARALGLMAIEDRALPAKQDRIPRSEGRPYFA